MRDFARGERGWPRDLKFRAPLATVDPPIHAAMLRAGGAMNSGPTGSLIVAARMRSTSALAGASRCQPLTSSTGSSWPGVACAPQRRGDALIEHPANRQMDHSLVEALPGELIELSHASEIPPKRGC